MAEADEDLDSHVVREASGKSLVDHVFFQADAQVSHEQGQALARIVIVTIVTLVLLGFYTADPGRPHLFFDLMLSATYALVSLAYHRWVSWKPHDYLWRRYIVIVTDLGLTGYINYRFGVAGLGFYPIYLWVVIGNGLRFGSHYLGVATAVGILSFSLANGLSGAASSHPGVFVGLLAGLLLMPRFFLVMIRRLADANRILARKKQEAEHQATHDLLTGLPNRSLLEDRVSQAVAQAKRTASHLALAFIDLDNFKSINDNFGHDAGDQLLSQVAECLTRSVRDTDTVARLGGDEFIVLLENCGDANSVAAIVDQLFGCSGRYYRIGHRETYVTWSCGVAIYPHDGATGGELIRNADTAMYKAKETGTNLFRLYDAEMSSSVAQQLVLRDALRRAIEDHQFEVHYQPQLLFPDGRVTNVEALVRWRHPDRGLLYPADFIAAAEKTGLVIQIGYQVLEQSLRDARRWRDDGVGEFRVHVNVSPHQLVQHDFPDVLKRLCEQYDWSPQNLGLEITEGVLIEDTGQSRAMLERLRGLGVVVSLDDFGTGFSSFSYLKKLPIDRLKIDRSFVIDIPDDDYDCTLVEATLMIARQLGIGLVAEGVESRVQFDWLFRHGCRQMQGFLFAPGLSATDLAHFVREHSAGFKL
jgi:diguanylate cyclase (GGDEF)-like protein